MRAIGAIVISVLILLYFFYVGGQQLKKDAEYYAKVQELRESYLGKKAVLDKDTLTIMDYHRGYYLLSNNIKVREEIINKLIIE